MNISIMNQTICFSDYKFDIELVNTSINIKVFNTTSLDLYEGSVNEAEIYVQPISKFYKMLVNGLNKENNFNFEINNLTDKLKCRLNYLNEFVDIEEFIILHKKANNKAVKYHQQNEINLLKEQVKLLSELLKNTIEHKLDYKIDDNISIIDPGTFSNLEKIYVSSNNKYLYNSLFLVIVVVIIVIVIIKLKIV